MRATAYDREAAAMMGIDTDRVIASTFFIGSVLAGAAGVMFGLLFSQVFHFMGFLAGLKGFTAAVVGGIGSIPGAMLGGLLVGLTESYAGRLPRRPLVRPDRLRDPHPRPPRPPERPARHAGDPEGLMRRAATARGRGSASTTGSRSHEGAASSSGAGLAGVRPPGRRIASLRPGRASPSSRAFAATLPLWMDRGDLFAYGIFTLIYILLGLGLNVVVGYAGLLDLGYVALLRLRRVLLRAALVRALRDPLAGAGLDPGRRGQHGAAGPRSSASPRGDCSATTSRS